MNKLLFVYNANSGKLNALLDAGHKLFSPSTYQCHLCVLTYDSFFENKRWKAFRLQSNINMEFYHVDEFEKTFPCEKFEYPVIIKQNENKLEVFMSKDELNALTSMENLIEHIKFKHLTVKE